MQNFIKMGKREEVVFDIAWVTGCLYILLCYRLEKAVIEFFSGNWVEPFFQKLLWKIE